MKIRTNELPKKNGEDRAPTPEVTSVNERPLLDLPCSINKLIKVNKPPRAMKTYERFE